MDLELDQFRDVDLVIDRANDSFVQKQFVSQGDYKGRTLTVQVTDNGSVGEVPGLTLNLNWHNEASGLTDLSAFSVLDKANSIYRIEYPQNMMTPGKVIASIQIIQDGKVTNLKQFELTVQRLAGQAVGIVDKAEFSALVAVLADANQFRTDIDSLSIEKADKAAVLADSNKFRTDIEAVGNEINKTKSVLQTQIDTLVLQPGDSTAEVIQARNDNMGNSFATLNGRVSNIENIASKNIGIIPGGWVVGGLSNGLPITASNRLLSNYLDPINQEITVNCLAGYKFRIYYYTSKDVFATVGEWQNGKATINTTYPFIRILLGKNDDTNVSIDDAANVEMTKPAAPEEISNARYSKALDVRYPEIGARFDYIDTSMSNMLEKEKYDLVWEIGGIGTTGINNTLTTRIRTVDFIDFQGNPIDVKIESGFKISVFEYNQNKELVKYEWLTEAFPLETENKLYRFCIAKVDDSNASIEFKEMVTFENQVATFKYLPQIQTLDSEVALIKDKIGSSNLSGKKLSVMGDSISAFQGYIPSGNAAYYTGQNSGVSSYEQMWWQRICDQTGMHRLVINAWSGSKVSGIDASISNFVPMSDVSRAQGLHTEDDDPDIIIVFGGTNDFSKENADIVTFEDAYHLMINRMQARYKSAKIYCLSLPIFVRTNTDKTGIEKNDEEKTVFDYNEVIRRVSNQRSCEYIDLNGCGITRQNMYPTYAIDYETIPTHPNSLGHDVYAKRILSRLL
nr:MAG TPA: GDSL-like Lipase/Acylhydrolase [Caudoviricetes sp.]